MVRKIIMAGALALFALPSLAQEEHRQLDSHEHGHGTFNIAIEGNKVTMELEAPGADIVGFEHEAKSDEHKMAIKEAISALESPLALFVFPSAAGCKLASAKVELEVGHHDEHEEGHDKDHDAKEDEHAKKDDDEEESHTEFHAEYELTCKSTEALAAINFKYFERFSGAEELEVKVVTANGQNQYEVERATPHLTLKGTM